MSGERGFIVVTGAFGYSGSYIARRLLDRGARVRTLTNSPQRRNPFDGRVEARRLDFDRPRRLVDSLRGGTALVNTYWVRFNHDRFRHADAVENTIALFRAAREAGVPRIVHVSITNPSEGSPFEYFRGKARLERALRETGIPHTILRPAVLFGGEDILVNNIAWTLRRFPVFGVFGDGEYGIEPIHVDDMARLAVEESLTEGSRMIDAVGPEAFTYRGLVEAIGRIIGRPRPILPLPPAAGYLLGRLLGALTRDVMITREEIGGLMAGLLATGSPPAGRIRLTDWARENRETLGARYASELARRRDRMRAYGEL
ncbi:MAG: SDR family oxidoreductase [Planctomycetota bacterium]